MEKLCTIQPEQWKNLGLVLKPISDQGTINIRESSIYQDINSGVAILFTDIKSLVGDGINFDIMNPSKQVKLFKLLETCDNDIQIMEDVENEQYVVSNNQIRIYLPKQTEKISPIVNKPDYEGLVYIGEPIKLDKSNRREIDVFIKSENSKDAIKLLIKDDQLVGFEKKETGVYLFPGYTQYLNLTSSNTDFTLKSLAFMLIQGEEFTIRIGKFPDDRYLLITDINTGFLEMSLNEEVDLSGDSDEIDWF